MPEIPAPMIRTSQSVALLTIELLAVPNPTDSRRHVNYVDADPQRWGLCTMLHELLHRPVENEEALTGFPLVRASPAIST